MQNNEEKEELTKSVKLKPSTHETLMDATHVLRKKNGRTKGRYGFDDAIREMSQKVING